MQRRSVIAGGVGALAGITTPMFLPTSASAQSKSGAQTVSKVEKPKVTIAVGGKSLLYYLPLTIAERLGYFIDEGLEVTIVDFSGGSLALRAVVGGSADIVSGAFEHTLNMQPKGQFLRAFALQGRAPQIVLGVNPRTMANYKSIADLKGKKIGVTAPGSSTQVLANFVLAKAGIKPSEVSFIGVGSGNGAVAAMRSGQIDAMSNVDPVVTLLQRSGDFRIVSDTRVVAEADKVFGGPMPAACMYAPQPFIDKYPGTIQAIANAIVRADRWIQAAGPSDVVKVVPESYLLGDRAVYIDAFMAAKGALSPDGTIPDAGAATALRALESVDSSLRDWKFDLSAVYTNDFVKRANQKYAKAP
jgi:NitT/TauT family transport system substrate-binding protein